MGTINRKDDRYLDFTSSDLFLKLNFANRVRVLFGCKVKIKTWVGTPWKTNIGITHDVSIDYFFHIRRRLDKFFNPNENIPDVPEDVAA